MTIKVTPKKIQVDNLQRRIKIGAMLNQKI